MSQRETARRAKSESPEGQAEPEVGVGAKKGTCLSTGLKTGLHANAPRQAIARRPKAGDLRASARCFENLRNHRARARPRLTC